MVLSQAIRKPPPIQHEIFSAAPQPEQARQSGSVDDCGCQTGREWSSRTLMVLAPIAMARGIACWNARRAVTALALAAAGGFSAGAVGKAVGMSRARRLRSGRN